MHPYRTSPTRELRPIPAPTRPPWGALLLLSFSVLATLAGAQSCAQPSQHDEPRFGIVRVALGLPLDSAGPWRQDQLDKLVAEIAALNALGPTFQVVEEGAPIVDVTVRPFDSGPRCARGAGRFTRGTHFVEVDAACCDGYDALQRAVGHEILHYLTDSRWGWIGHLCMHASDAADCHTSIAGDSVLNPALGYLDDGPRFDAVWTPVSAGGAPTTADLALIARCRDRGCP